MQVTIHPKMDWQPEPKKNLVTSIPVKEGLKLEKIRSTKQSHVISEKIQNIPRTQKNSEPIHSWNEIQGLSWLFLEGLEDY